MVDNSRPDTDSPPDSESPPVVLIVEDERDLADLFATWLTERYEVKTAYDAEAALETIDERVDVVLLDRRLPGMSGDEVLGRIRERGLSCRVGMVTAVDPDFDLLKLDVDGYLTKPVSREELRDIVDEMAIRNDLEDDLKSYLALASKKRALEREKGGDALEADPRYDILTAELADRRPSTPGPSVERAESDGDAGADNYPHRRIAADLAAVTLLVPLLIGTYLMAPDAAEQLMAVDSPQTDPAIALASAYVHADFGHLLGNVMGYLVVTPIAYLASFRLRALGWFYATTLALVTVLPVVGLVVSLELLALLAPSVEPTFVGFSQVLFGFVGFSMVAVVTLFGVIYDARALLATGVFFTCTGTATVLGAHGFPSASVVAVIGAFSFGGFTLQRLHGVRTEVESRRAALVNLVTVAVLGLLYAGIGAGIAPTGSDPTFGTVGHLVGFAGGVAIATASALLFHVVPVRERLRREGHPVPKRVL